MRESNCHRLACSMGFHRDLKHVQGRGAKQIPVGQRVVSHFEAPVEYQALHSGESLIWCFHFRITSIFMRQCSAPCDYYVSVRQVRYCSIGNE